MDLLDLLAYYMDELFITYSLKKNKVSTTKIVPVACIFLSKFL